MKATELDHGPNMEIQRLRVLLTRKEICLGMRERAVRDLEQALLAIAVGEPAGSVSGDIARAELDRHGVNWRHLEETE